MNTNNDNDDNNMIQLPQQSNSLLVSAFNSAIMSSQFCSPISFSPQQEELTRSPLPNGFLSFSPGTKTIYDELVKLYPDQPNPLQASTVVKFWAGGPDPLDYISMYYNSGNVDLQVPPHWHYITFGFSDLYGDDRLHTRKNLSPEQNNENDIPPSGHGFELTMRVKKESEDTCPPSWPALLLQKIAKYVYQTGNGFIDGDHVSWHQALDNEESEIKHMVIAKDPQLNNIVGPNGSVEFLQVIGILHMELLLIQQWNGRAFLELMRRYTETGSEYLITDMRRVENIIELRPELKDEINAGIEIDGSNLSGVSTECLWLDKTRNYNPVRDPINPEIHDSMLVVFVLESVCLIPLVASGRIKHGRHFTFKSSEGDLAITFTTENIDGSMSTEENKFVSKGNWLHIYVVPEMMNEIYLEVVKLIQLQDKIYEHIPKILNFPKWNFKLAITHSCDIFNISNVLELEESYRYAS